MPLANNEAERAFRMMKVGVKMSGCFRTSRARARLARIRNYPSTLRKQGLHVLEYLGRALDGHRFLPHPSKAT